MHSPTVTMATNKGWRCRAGEGETERDRKGRREGKEEWEAGGEKEICKASSSLPRCVQFNI